MLRSSGTVRLAARAACAATWPPNSRGRRIVAARVHAAEDVAVELLEVEHVQQLGDVARLGFAPFGRPSCRHRRNRRRHHRRDPGVMPPDGTRCDGRSERGDRGYPVGPGPGPLEWSAPPGSNVASSPNRPRNCTPIGRPAAFHHKGTDIAGLPVKLAMTPEVATVRPPRSRMRRRRARRGRRDLADARRRLRQRGREHGVEPFEEEGAIRRDSRWSSSTAMR